MKKQIIYRCLILISTFLLFQLILSSAALAKVRFEEDTCVCGEICPIGTVCKEINNLYPGDENKKSLIQICGCVANSTSSNKNKEETSDTKKENENIQEHGV